MQTEYLITVGNCQSDKFFGRDHTNQKDYFVDTIPNKTTILHENSPAVIGTTKGLPIPK